MKASTTLLYFYHNDPMKYYISNPYAEIAICTEWLNTGFQIVGVKH